MLSINSPLYEGNDKPLELVESLSADLLQMLIHGSCGRQDVIPPDVWSQYECTYERRDHPRSLVVGWELQVCVSYA